MNSSGTIKKVAGPLIIAKGMKDANLFDVVEVSEHRLVGEIIEIHDDEASIQVYEETSGLGPGEVVESTGMPLSVELGPGLLGTIYDGIQRPLLDIKHKSGVRINRGVKADPLSRGKGWNFVPLANVGDIVEPGDIIGFVQEGPTIEHKIMIPKLVHGRLASINPGTYHVTDVCATVEQEDKIIEITLMQNWPVRVGRPYKRKLSLDTPLLTGQRVIDMLFPIAVGGVAAVPGPFGSGKTVVQHQLAKWANADIIVYIGCGERGNEMTDVLNEFPELKDAHTGHSLMQRTVLIANTSDMPVAAREASIYTGITIAEYYRDMGYSVALMADSTSRWAEALREMSGRLEEMPGEEGYPAYLGSRLAQFYERAGKVISIGKLDRIGSISIIGAVSPQGGDISEPVTQATLRIVKAFWGLDASLAYQRHFPAINWLTSYSLYNDALDVWFNSNVNSKWAELRITLMRFLQEEAELNEIVKLVGVDSLSKEDRLKLATARSIREDFLHQDAYHAVDTHTTPEKQLAIITAIFMFYEKGLAAIQSGTSIDLLLNIPTRESIGRLKYVTEENISEELLQIESRLTIDIKALTNFED